jgi:hypothetical protein
MRGFWGPEGDWGIRRVAYVGGGYAEEKAPTAPQGTHLCNTVIFWYLLLSTKTFIDVLEKRRLDRSSQT